jgi:hypothetical protein
VRREGFKQAEIARLTVNVGDHIEENFALEVGVKEAVTVESESALVDTLSSTISSVVLRNSDLNANNFLNQDTPGSYQPRPILRCNQFGPTTGGPITLSKLVNGRDRFFFFFGYQGQRQTNVAVAPQVTTYTPAELAGDFSHAVNERPTETK